MDPGSRHPHDLLDDNVNVPLKLLYEMIGGRSGLHCADLSITNFGVIFCLIVPA